MKNPNLYSYWNCSLKSKLQKIGNQLFNGHPARIFFTFLLVGSLASCGNGTQNKNDSVDSAKSINKMNIKDSTTSLTKDETDFMVKAANGGMSEVKLGELAGNISTNKMVDQFGAKMVKDHGAANDQLKSIASQLNVTLPAAIDQSEQDNYDKLKEEKGDKFDKDYADLMVKEHKDAVNLFQNASKNTSNQTLLDFINNTLPTLQEHLQLAETLKKEMK